MGTSHSMAEFAGKMHQAARNTKESRMASFRTAESRMLPRFRDQARAAAGPDRRLSRHRSKAPLDAKFKVTESGDTAYLFINGTGPWGIRDNTDVGGKTVIHGIRAKRVQFLKFVGKDGATVYKRQVIHPGSNRSEFWRQGRDEAFRYLQKRIPQDTIDAISAALEGAAYRKPTA